MNAGQSQSWGTGNARIRRAKDLSASGAVAWGCAFLLLTSLAGCVATPPTKPVLTASDKEKIHKITILQVAPPKQIAIQVSKAGLVRSSGPWEGVPTLLGAAVHADNQASSSQYASALATAGFALSPSLVAGLRAALACDGYQTEYVEDPAASGRMNTRVDHAGVSADSDAILQTTYQFAGYFSRTMLSDYVPLVEVSIRVVDAKTGQEIDVERIAATVPQESTVAHSTGASTPRFTYASARDLIAQASASSQGILDAQGIVVSRIARRFAKPGTVCRPDQLTEALAGRLTTP